MIFLVKVLKIIGRMKVVIVGCKNIIKLQTHLIKLI